MTNFEQRTAAKKFASFWKDKGYEKGMSQSFWLSLLRDVYGVEHPEEFITFEDKVHIDHTSFIDGMIKKTHVLIEQKSLDKSLTKPIKQSDGTLLTPYQQAKRYSAELPYSQRPRWIVTCNFSTFHIYDMENPSGEPEVIKLENLEQEYYRMEFLVQEEKKHIQQEVELSIKAGDIVGVLYDAILKQYIDPTNEHSLKSLNMLCVRLVFCLYAEDSGLFGRYGLFHDYLAQFKAEDIREALIKLFRILNQKKEERDPYLKGLICEFPYVNGGLFADENIEIPNFTEECRAILLSKASDDFKWSDISPTIFGAVFESTLNPETRRSGGMHYTSIENIHKVIEPLFLEQLIIELSDIKNGTKNKKVKLQAYQDKLADLKFLDPACGSGNFLTETYLSLRRLENEVISELIALEKGITIGQIILGTENINPIKVSINQFYGIEINDFAVTVAKTALWIAESQMMRETEDIVHMDLDFLPLKTQAHIVEGNALQIDWESIISKKELNYIMGNPPFVGARLMSNTQKKDVMTIFNGWKNVGNLDYVCCWYKKVVDMQIGTDIQAALVSTNSITQGEMVANLWKPLLELGVHIDFAYRTFRWDSEAKIKAHVHCVIVGFSSILDNRKKRLFISDRYLEVSNINGYLVDADNIFIESRSKAICDVPTIGIGNKPIDGGFYLFTEEEKDKFIKNEPASAKWFKLWYGSNEFINRKPRYCLWLGNCSPNELRKMPECLKRVESVRNFRLASKSVGTIKLADNPTHFHVENMPKENYILIPKVSSEKRRYIPIGFMTPNVLCSDLVFIVQNATLYHFGVLTSNVHMAWMRAVAGRLEMRYRYSKDIVYNNFPWCNPTDEQKAKIEKTAQAILDARELYPDCSLADLYDELIMPSELRKAHNENNKAVMQAYGFPIKDFTESDCVAELMKMYQNLVQE